MSTGLQNHQTHIGMMRDGLMDHTKALSTGAGGADLSVLMQELQDMKARVDSLDRAGRLGAGRERSGAELVDLMQRRRG